MAHASKVTKTFGNIEKDPFSKTIQDLANTVTGVSPPSNEKKASIDPVMSATRERLGIPRQPRNISEETPFDITRIPRNLFT